MGLIRLMDINEPGKIKSMYREIGKNKDLKFRSEKSMKTINIIKSKSISFQTIFKDFNFFYCNLKFNIALVKTLRK